MWQLTEEGIKKRLEVYHTYVKPPIGFYTDRGLLANVNALQSIDAISGDIEKILGGIK